MHRILYGVAAIITILLFAACQPQSPAAAQPAVSPTPMDTALPSAPDASSASPAETVPGGFTISSSGIVDGVILDAYGARGAQKSKGIPNRSFALSLQNVPEGTVCLALSVIDPDGGNWVHWLAANLPVADLAENASVDLADGMLQGKNGFDFVGYGGPTPPGGTHTYVITVYALSESVSLKNGFSYKQFQEAIDQKVIASTTLTGDYAH